MESAFLFHFLEFLRGIPRLLSRICPDGVESLFFPERRESDAEGILRVEEGRSE